MWKTLLVILFVLNALFWGLASHAQHCKVASAIGVTCISHMYHITFGALCFLVAIYIQHFL